MSSTLDQRLAALQASGKFPEDIVSRFRAFVLESPEHELYRTNPLRFAALTDTPEPIAVELFVCAARVGLLDFSWGVVCGRCGLFIGTRAGLHALTDAARCTLCRITIAPEADGNVEITFTVNSAVRFLRFHRPLAEQPLPDVFLSAFSASLALSTAFQRGMAEVLSRQMVGKATLAGGESADIDVEVDAEHFFGVGAPLHHAGGEIRVVPGAPRVVSLELLDGRLIPEVIEVAPGPVTLAIRNQSSRTAEVGVRRLTRDEVAAIERGDSGLALVPNPLPMLSAKRLLASQAFRDLFRTESLPGEAGVAVRNLTLLFTDLKGSTALYDRVGDLRAFALVREHFKLLRDAVHDCGGAVVKTMGDAVMANFADPLSGLEAALTMHQALARKDSELLLKVGLHSGGCIAVEDNERLDYFGQTVNIAARVQALADAREIVCTDSLYDARGVSERVARAGLAVRHEQASLRGIEGLTGVVRLAPGGV